MDSRLFPWHSWSYNGEVALERDTHFVTVGIFVFALLIGGAVFFGWIAGNDEEQARLRYSVYFDGGIFGLSEGGPVRYLGVQVGNIQKIALDPSRPDSVHVVVQVDDSAPIYTNTTAELKTQGITGLAYIELRNGDGEKEPLRIKPGEIFPVIRSVPNDLDEFISSLPSLTTRFEQISKQVLKLLSDENLKQFSSTLNHVEKATGQLPETLSAIEVASRDITASFSTLEDAADRLGKASDTVTEGMGAIMPNAEQVLLTADTLLKDINRLSEKLNHRVDKNSDGIDQVFEQGVPELLSTMAELRTTLNQMNRLVDRLNSDPSQLIYKPNYKKVEAE